MIEPTAEELIKRHKDCKVFTIDELIKQAKHEDAMDYRQIRFGRILDEYLDVECWRRNVEIVINYMPNHPDERTKPRVIIRYKTAYLRYSGGPGTGTFWDCYGDDFLNLDLAFFEALKAQGPRRLE